MADPKFVKFNPEAQAAHDAWHQQMASIDAENAILRARAAEIIKLKTDLDARRDKAHAAHTHGARNQVRRYCRPRNAPCVAGRSGQGRAGHRRGEAVWLTSQPAVPAGSGARSIRPCEIFH